MELFDSFLGRGWSFPPTFDTTGVRMIRDEEDIRSSLEILLSTTTGERVMQPTFGCNLEEMVFESMDTSFETYIKKKIEDSILLFEPRVDLKSVTLVNSPETEGLLMIHVDYLVRATNTRSNLVYPFYRTEGTDI